MIKELKTIVSLEEETGEGSQKRKLLLIKDSLSPRMEYIYDVCFNPFVTTKLSHLDFSETPVEHTDSTDDLWETFFNLVEDLKKSPAANDSLRGRACLLVSKRIDHDDSVDLILRKALSKILTKRMNVGIGAKLINKSVGRDLIPDPSLMLASDNQREISKWDKIYCEEKYDGVRIIAKGNSDGFKFYTRAFNELDKSKLSLIEAELVSAIKGINLDSDIFFDGELTDLNRKSVSGKITQILKGTAPAGIDSEFVFNIFDIENSSVLEIGRGNTPFIERREKLGFILGPISSDSSRIRIARQWEADTMDEVNEIYSEIISKGGEGVILKPGNHFYECKRSNSWVKLKQIQDCDLEIVGWYPGEGKREGLIGGFVCTDLSKTLSVKIGSGFTDSDLKELSKNPESLIGKIAAVQYNEPITDKFGARSLFLPRFVEIRNDKFNPDDMSSIF